MITRFLTECTTAFNPFSPRAKCARIFLSLLPTTSAGGKKMKVTTKLLPKDNRARSVLKIKFSDGKELDLNAEKLGIKGVMDEVDRHSRLLGRQEALTGN
ncbi:MAG: 39S ribosomal protein L44, mitochondrial [Caeruleum heppii]|nr:MAG: 39S ribosomal protein L44, mitochondrial [Caeruleum heppii]